MRDGKKVLIGMSAEELGGVVSSLGLRQYAARQIMRRLYVSHVTDVREMTELSKESRDALAEEYVVGSMAPVASRRSVDGTVKYLFPTSGGKSVEAVFIPDKDRGTLCVSSQVGCRMGCWFCMTGKQGFEGNLTAGDILNQVYALPERARLTNIVFMGQGEPLDNIDAVLGATRLLTSPEAYAWSPKRITISTVGVRRTMRRLLEESDCHVAVSLHSPSHEERLSLVPAERQMPIESIVELLRGYDFTRQRRLSFEYTVFGGLNDSARHAKAIVRLVGGLKCRVNLIRFHPVPGVDLRPATEETMTVFRDYLTAHGVYTTIRASRGQDIFAACGMLSTTHRKGGSEVGEQTGKGSGINAASHTSH